MDDVQRLDTLCWRAVKNQTISRSKVGQEPRLYMRVEYADEGFHIGGLARDVRMDEDHSKPADQLRDVRDISIDATALLDRLERHADRIRQVRVAASDVLELTNGGEVLTAGDSAGEHDLYDVLRGTLGEASVDVIDVYEEARETLPSAT